jgi:hypothetical protein
MINARLAAPLLFVMTLNACAGGPPERSGPRRGPEGRAPAGQPRDRLFISPAGEPFRAPAGQPYPMDVWWSRLAGPADRITPAILGADFERAFAIFDADRDGAIGPAEVTIYETRTAPEILRGGARGLAGAAPYSLLNDPQPIRSADFNLDGRVTLIEYQRKAREVFVRLDRSRDGVLTRTELPTPMLADPRAQMGAENPRRGRPPGGGPPGGGPRGGGRGPR